MQTPWYVRYVIMSDLPNSRREKLLFFSLNLTSERLGDLPSLQGLKLGFRMGLADSRDNLPISMLYYLCLLNNLEKSGKRYAVSPCLCGETGRCLDMTIQ